MLGLSTLALQQTLRAKLNANSSRSSFKSVNFCSASAIFLSFSANCRFTASAAVVCCCRHSTNSSSASCLTVSISRVKPSFSDKQLVRSPVVVFTSVQTLLYTSEYNDKLALVEANSVLNSCNVAPNSETLILALSTYLTTL